MGHPADSFWRSSIYEFITMKQAYMKQHGIKEERLATESDLDDMYAAFAEVVAENPEVLN